MFHLIREISGVRPLVRELRRVPTAELVRIEQANSGETPLAATVMFDPNRVPTIVSSTDPEPGWVRLLRIFLTPTNQPTPEVNNHAHHHDAGDPDLQAPGAPGEPA